MDIPYGELCLVCPYLMTVCYYLAGHGERPCMPQEAVE